MRIKSNADKTQTMLVDKNNNEECLKSPLQRRQSRSWKNLSTMVP